jgi:hypothetical protein
MPDATNDPKAVREALEGLVHGVESLFSSLPFSAPENVAFLAQAKLSGPLEDAREALGADR